MGLWADRNRAAIGNVQLYNPGQQFDRRPVEPSRRYTPRQGQSKSSARAEWWENRQAVVGGGAEEEGASGFGRLIDNQYVRALATGGGVLTTLGRGVASVIKEANDFVDPLDIPGGDATKALLGGPFGLAINTIPGYTEQNADEASFGDWLDQTKDFEFGMGQVFPDMGGEDPNGWEKWGNRAVGLTGDIITDPFTWIGAAPATATGKAARSTKLLRLAEVEKAAQATSDRTRGYRALVGQADDAAPFPSRGLAPDAAPFPAMTGGDEADALLKLLGGETAKNRIGKRGLNTANDAQLRAMGLDGQGLRFRFGGAPIPGTAKVGKAFNEGIGGIRAGIKDIPFADKAFNLRHPLGVKGQPLGPAYNRILGVGDESMPMNEALSQIGANNDMRLGAKAMQGRARIHLKALSDEIKGLDDDQMKALRLDADTGNPENILNKTAQRMIDSAAEIGVDLPKIEGVAYSMPHTLNRKFRLHLQKALSKGEINAEKFADLQGIHRVNLMKDSGFLAKRDLVPGRPIEIGDQVITLRNGTVDELNEQLSKVFPDYKGPIYETNPGLAYRHYVEGISQDVGARLSGKRTAARGLGAIEDAGPAPETFDPLGTKTADDGAEVLIDRRKETPGSGFQENEYYEGVSTKKAANKRDKEALDGKKTRKRADEYSEGTKRAKEVVYEDGQRAVDEVVAPLKQQREVTNQKIDAIRAEQRGLKATAGELNEALDAVTEEITVNARAISTLQQRSRRLVGRKDRVIAKAEQDVIDAVDAQVRELLDRQSQLLDELPNLNPTHKRIADLFEVSGVNAAERELADARAILSEMSVDDIKKLTPRQRKALAEATEYMNSPQRKQYVALKKQLAEAQDAVREVPDDPALVAKLDEATESLGRATGRQKAASVAGKKEQLRRARADINSKISKNKQAQQAVRQSLDRENVTYNTLRQKLIEGEDIRAVHKGGKTGKRVVTSSATLKANANGSAVRRSRYQRELARLKRELSNFDKQLDELKRKPQAPKKTQAKLSAETQQARVAQEAAEKELQKSRAAAKAKAQKAADVLKKQVDELEPQDVEMRRRMKDAADKYEASRPGATMDTRAWSRVVRDAELEVDTAVDRVKTRAARPELPDAKRVLSRYNRAKKRLETAKMKARAAVKGSGEEGGPSNKRGPRNNEGGKQFKEITAEEAEAAAEIFESHIGIHRRFRSDMQEATRLRNQADYHAGEDLRLERIIGNAHIEAAKKRKANPGKAAGHMGANPEDVLLQRQHRRKHLKLMKEHDDLFGKWKDVDTGKTTFKPYKDFEDAVETLRRRKTWTQAMDSVDDLNAARIEYRDAHRSLLEVQGEGLEYENLLKTLDEDGAKTVRITDQFDRIDKEIKSINSQANLTRSTAKRSAKAGVEREVKEIAGEVEARKAISLKAKAERTDVENQIAANYDEYAANVKRLTESMEAREAAPAVKEQTRRFAENVRDANDKVPGFTQQRNAAEDALSVAKAAMDEADPALKDDLVRAAAHLEEYLDSLNVVQSATKDAATQRKIVKSLENGNFGRVTEAKLRSEFHWYLPEDPTSRLVMTKQFNQAMMASKEMGRDPGLTAKTFKAFTNYFKTYATISPGFHVRNAIGAIFMNSVAGVPMHMNGKALKLWYQMVHAADPDDFFRNLPKAQQDAFDAVFASGAGGRFFEEGFAESLGSGSKLKEKIFSNKLTRGSQKLGEYVEGPVRLAMAMDSTMNRGLDVYDTLDKITQFHFDYGQASKFDESMKRLIPFWTFMSRNLPTQMEMMYTHPRVYNYYYNFMKNMGEGNDPLTPEYWEEQGAVGLGVDLFGKELLLQPDLQHVRLTDEFEKIANAANGDFSRLLSDFNPAITAPVEWQTGKDFFSGYQTPEDESRDIKLFDMPAAVLGSIIGRTDWDEGQVDERWSELMYSLNPLLSQAGRLVPQLTGDPYRSGRQAESIARYGTGAPIRQLTERARQREAERQGVPYTPRP